MQAAIYGSDPWPNINVYRFLQYVPLDQISRIRASYYTSKQDPIVMLDTEEEEYPPHDAPQDQTVDDFFGFSWKPNKLCSE